MEATILANNSPCASGQIKIAIATLRNNTRHSVLLQVHVNVESLPGTMIAYVHVFSLCQIYQSSLCDTRYSVRRVSR